MSEISKDLLSRTYHDILTSARTYTPVCYPILLLLRFKRQRELKDQLCCVTFWWLFRAEMPWGWSPVSWQLSPSVGNQMRLIAAGFQHCLPSLPYSSTPGLCSNAFSISLLDTRIYIYPYIYKSDFAASGNCSEAISGKTHPSGLLYPLHFQAVSCSFPSYLTCSFIVWSHWFRSVSVPHCKPSGSVFHTEADAQGTFTMLVSCTVWDVFWRGTFSTVPVDICCSSFYLTRKEFVSVILYRGLTE